MLRIAKSLITIAAVAAIAVGATGAYFTDEVKITNNSISTGTININVDDNDGTIASKFVLKDMKPGYIQNSDFVVTNTGTNPANVYKKVEVTGDTADLASVIDYSLSVKIPGVGGDWNQTLYDYDKTVAQIQGSPMYLGMLPVGASMNVTESYQMQTTVTDVKYQGQTMIFDITVTGEQLKGTLTLENKDTSNWQIMGGDAMTGTLTYSVMDKKFNYTFVGNGLVTGTDYTLVMGSDYPFVGGAIGNATAVAGVVNISNSVELGNKTNQKVWLVPTADYSGSIIAWNPSSYLFETGLIDYYDSGV